MKRSLSFIAFLASCMGLVSLGYTQTEVSGSVSGTWITGGSPYIVIGDIDVSQGETLTIEAGVVVKFNWSLGLMVNGTLEASGQEGQEIYFTSVNDHTTGGATGSGSPSPGDWDGMKFGDSSDDAACVLDHCVIRYGGARLFGYSANVYCESASPAISNCVITYSEGDGIKCDDADPLISNNTIAHNANYAVYIQPTSYPVFEENSVNGNGYNGIGVEQGDLTRDGTWFTDIPYIIQANDDVRVNEGVTLTVSPGAVVKFPRSSGLIIDGSLVARGSVGDSIVFTSLQDDGYGGDTNGDSSATAPAPGDWDGMKFGDTSDDGACVLDHCVIQYGGARIFGYSANVYCESASPAISNCRITHSEIDGIRCDDSDPLISNNTIAHNTSYAVYIQPTSYPVFEDNSVNGNGANGIGVEQGDLTRDGTWFNDIPYIIKTNDDVRVTEGVTLTVSTGAVVKFPRSSGLIIDGSLVARGAAGDSIVFTSLQDDGYGGDTNGDGSTTTPSPGNWDGMKFGDSSDDAACVLDHCVIRYGGKRIFGYSANVYCESASPTISHCRITHGEIDGIRCQLLANPYITGNIIAENNGSGVMCDQLSVPAIILNSMTENAVGVLVHEADPVSFFNTLTDNTQYAIQYDSFMSVDGRYNYWGTETTAEMAAGENPKDIAAIHDNFDDANVGSVDYGNWLSTSEERHTVVIRAYPDEYPNHGLIEVTVYGWGFQDGATVKLVKSGNNDIFGNETDVIDSTRIVTQFDLSGVETGTWNIMVTNPGGGELILPGGFTIVEPFEIPVVETADFDGRGLFRYWVVVPKANNLFVTFQKVEIWWGGMIRVIYNNRILFSQSGDGDHLFQLEDPDPGIYSIEIIANHGGTGLLKAGTSLQNVGFDEMMVGIIYRNDGYDWSQINVPNGIDTLDFTLETVGNVSRLDVWYDNFDNQQHWWAEQHFDPPVRLTIVNPASGNYYLSAYDHGQLAGSQVRDYSISVDYTGEPVYDHDAVTVRILSPEIVTQFQSATTPQALIRNNGTERDTIPVNMHIGSYYSEYTEVILSPGDSGVVSFPEWNTNNLGNFPVSCNTFLPTDMYTDNDTVAGNSIVLEDITAPAIFTVEPNSGGNYGAVSVTVRGQGFEPGAGAKLARAGSQDILAYDTTFVDSGEMIFAIDLTGGLLGSWDVVLMNPDGQELVLPEGFHIEGGAESDVWVEIVGRKEIRAGRETTFIIQYGNSGDSDAIGVPLWIAGIPPNASLEPGFEIVDPPPSDSTASVNWDEIPWYFEDNGEIIIPLVIPRIPPKSSGKIEIMITVPDNVDFQLQAWLNPPFAHSPATPSVITCMHNLLKGLVGETDFACLLLFFESLTDGLGASEKEKDRAAFLGNLIQALILECSNVWTPEEALLTVIWIIGVLSDAGQPKINNGNQPCCKSNVTEQENNESCNGSFCRRGSALISVSVVNSLDPNEKVGPSGYTFVHAVSLENPFHYQVYFENVDSATAAAQEIEILDTLDTNLDWSTFAFGDATMSDTTYTVLHYPQTFNKEIILNDTTELSITGTFDQNEGIIRWYLKGTDTRTGDWGDILPPNVNPPEGEGHVNFRVNPKPILLSGTEIRNRASIVFDVNPPILTNEVFNTIDARTPASSVHSVSNASATSDFQVHWSGTDDVLGSGIRDYFVYAADNGGSYQLWLPNTSDTSDTFAAEGDHTYWFYSISNDSVGNREDHPDSPDLIVWNAKYDFTYTDWYLAALSNHPHAYGVSDLFSEGIQAYGWVPESQTYVEVTTLNASEGYWFGVPEGVEIYIAGTPLYEYAKHFQVGWHLIGAVTQETDFTHPHDDPDGSVTGAYGWDPVILEYFNTTELLPNHGYWIAVIHECDLNVGKEVTPTETLTPEEIETLTTDFNEQHGENPPEKPSVPVEIQSVSEVPVPEIYKLYQNYPNPFNPRTVIRYQLPKPGRVSIKIYNILGQMVKTLVDEKQEAGYYRTFWNGRNQHGVSVSSGLYFYRIDAGKFHDVKKMLILK